MHLINIYNSLLIRRLMKTVKDLEKQNLLYYQILKKNINQVKHLIIHENQHKKQKQIYAINLTQKASGAFCMWRTPIILVLKHGKSIGYFQTYKSTEDNFLERVPARQKEMDIQIIDGIVCQQNNFTIRFKKGVDESDWRFYFDVSCKHLNEEWAKMLLMEIRGLEKKKIRVRAKTKSLILQEINQGKKNDKQFMKVEDLIKNNHYQYMSFSNKINFIENKEKMAVSLVKKKGKSGISKKEAIIILKFGESVIEYFYQFEGKHLDLEHEVPLCKGQVNIKDITKITHQKNQLKIQLNNNDKSSIWNLIFFDKKQKLSKQWHKLLETQISKIKRQDIQKQKKEQILQKINKQNEQYSIRQDKDINSMINHLSFEQLDDELSRNNIIKNDKFHKANSTDIKNLLYLQYSNEEESQNTQVKLNTSQEQSLMEQLDDLKKLYNQQNVKFRELEKQLEVQKKQKYELREENQKIKKELTEIKEKLREGNDQSQNMAQQLRKEIEQLRDLKVNLQKQKSILGESNTKLQKQVIKSLLKIDQLIKMDEINNNNDIGMNFNSNLKQKILKLENNRKELVEEIEEMKLKLKQSEEEKMKLKMKVNILSIKIDK